MRPLRALPLAVMLVAVSACVSHRAPKQSTRATPAAAPILLRVDSHHWSDVTIYAVRDGVRLRVGTVSAAGSATFRIPPYLLNFAGELQLVGDPLGGGRPIRMDPIYIRPGGFAEWTLESNLKNSSLGVW